MTKVRNHAPKKFIFFMSKNLWLSSHRQPSTADFILISLDDVRNITAPIWVNHCWKKRHSWTLALYSDNYFRKWKSSSREAENPWQILFVLSASFNGKNFIDLVRTYDKIRNFISMMLRCKQSVIWIRVARKLGRLSNKQRLMSHMSSLSI